ncbi:MAG: hypothetical protein JKY49_10975 [Cohaesibacteraceae bacterium]|nr:hypothetical protein [Cohaesibacteraceae bacterium]MBL4875066.1 hypothetical protein [Cohaesibacteraceae bacterium]
MKCLIVGGTGFQGGALTDAIVNAGHQTSIMVRGETNRPLPDNVDIIRADRYDPPDLKDRNFDWVFDTCAFTPDAVNALLDAVGDNIKRYVLISSISAYGTFTKPELTEDHPVPAPGEEDFEVARKIPKADRGSAAAYGGSYGALKRGCELAAIERLGDRASLLRVGLLVGAGDYTNRLTWWMRRIDMAHGDMQRVPAPGPKTAKIQFIDVRDVAGFALGCCEKKLPGVWNVTGQPVSLEDLLNSVVEAIKSPAEFVWFDPEEILAAGIQPWTDFPLMTPAVPGFEYFMQIDTQKAQAAGLQIRPLIDTLEPLLAWDRGRRDVPLGCGLKPEQEQLLLG